MHNSTNCPVCRGLPGQGSMSDEQFHAFVTACREELAQKQSQFRARIESAGRWWCELEIATISFDERQFPITVVGSQSPQDQTWLWAWANECLPERARTASQRLQALFTRTGFRVFLDPGLPASAEDAQDLTALAVHELEAIGFYRCPSDDGPTLYLAVHEPATTAAS